MYKLKTDTYDTVSGISSGLLKLPAHSKNLFSQSVGLCPGTLKVDVPKKNRANNTMHKKLPETTVREAEVPQLE